VPTVVVPKLYGVGEMLSPASWMPRPWSDESAWTRPSVAVSVVIELRSAVGEKITDTVQVAAGASTIAAHVFDAMLKSPAAPPPSVTIIGALEPVPTFVTVNVLGALLCPLTTSPKSWIDGVSVRAAAGGGPVSGRIEPSNPASMSGFVDPVHPTAVIATAMVMTATIAFRL
jgi:hypothetical protein